MKPTEKLIKMLKESCPGAKFNVHRVANTFCIRMLWRDIEVTHFVGEESVHANVVREWARMMREVCEREHHAKKPLLEPCAEDA